MFPEIDLRTTPAGLVAAVAALAGGAPLFSAGLRAHRLRRRARRLIPVPVGARPEGFAHVVGRVVLESPLFSPLSGQPCAAYRLEVSTSEESAPHPVDVLRPFRLVERGVEAGVRPEGARLALPETARREVPAVESLPSSLAALVERVPEASWHRANGGTLTLVERALVAGATGHVVGTARRTGAVAALEVGDLLRTGTDDVAVVARPAAVATSVEPDLWLGAGDHLDFLLVSDRAPDPAALHAPAWRAAGVVVGPALSLLGLLYLARVADHLRALARD